MLPLAAALRARAKPGIIAMSEAEREAPSESPTVLSGFALDAPVPSPADGAAKSCGSCTLCCTIMGVPELKKRPWEPCRHVSGAGCTIYAERPAGCRSFMCGWLLDPGMGSELKPEKCHVVLQERGELHIVATCDPAYPDAWRAPHVISYLHSLAKAIAPTRRVLLMERNRLWYVTENAVVPTDIG
jgi:hypothetical protein